MYVSDAVLWFDPICFVHLQFHGAPWYFTEILSYFNWVFTLLFTVECAFKLLSFGPKVSRKSRKFFFSSSSFLASMNFGALDLHRNLVREKTKLVFTLTFLVRLLQMAPEFFRIPRIPQEDQIIQARGQMRDLEAQFLID